MVKRSANYLIHSVTFLAEEIFRRFLLVERKRSERSGDPWVLVHLDIEQLKQQHSPDLDPVLLDSICSCLAATFRETDLIGWYQDQRAMGVIVTELRNGSGQGVPELILGKLRKGLRAQLSDEVLGLLGLSVYAFPETRAEDLPDEIRRALFPEEALGFPAQRLAH